MPSTCYTATTDDKYNRRRANRAPNSRKGHWFELTVSEETKRTDHELTSEQRRRERGEGREIPASDFPAHRTIDQSRTVARVR